MNDFFQLQLIIFVNVLFIIHCVTEKRRPPLKHALTDKIVFEMAKFLEMPKVHLNAICPKIMRLRLTLRYFRKKLVISRIDLAFHCSCA